MKSQFIAALGLITLLTACGGGGGGDAEQTTDTSPSSKFPEGLALSSPFDLVTASSRPTSSLNLASRVSIAGMETHYAWTTAQIDRILNGTTPVRDAFTPELFFSFPINAECFGPSVRYENHPDYYNPPDPSGSVNGELPTGDLGLWTETDAASGHACAPAELNVRLNGMSRQGRGALMMVASMIATANNNGIALPETEATISVSSELDTDIADPNIHVSQADIRLNSDGSWTYQLLFEYTKSWPVGGDYTHTISVQLDHTPSPSDATNAYSGLIAYWISGDGGDAHFPGGNCPGSSDRTYNGSLKYERTDLTAMKIQSRAAIFCGTNIDAGISGTADDAGMVNDDYVYDGSNNGWSENFDLFAAEFDPDSLAGKYTYAWQAGSGDSHTRIFNIGVSEVNNTLTGESYFGYGDPMGSTNGTIQTFICNWAGPNGGVSLADRSHNDRVQRQHFTLDTSTGLFEPTNSGASNIVYAPTNSCDYSEPGVNGSFIYDTDGDGLLTGETAVSINNDLWNGTAADITAGNTLPDIVIDRGFSLTGIPGGWPSEN
ncbi:MAG: hypothetical protein QNJ78_06260 [Gammaproteobacteria bacterium]|nr:hypothetical protein [Gammaproteobacteria bacterium]